MKNKFTGTEISCDSCNRRFKIKKLKTEWINSNVQKVYFTCPYCKKDYTCFYVDKRVRKNIKKIDNLKKLYDEIVRENKEILQQLKEKYET
ncbi:hypothetical protein HBE96_06580 [Clostridium sp. P21]|uniref:Transglycosylase n=1 Tax=Clostridium muellerianum TaxID=2716538 RepID=A0A7Y0HP61_9CLOT|nr:hypothetical protein [Clostridium muellerianum]NMM62358.1 hypothetical protein [Clostridium muellerianum]